MKTTFKAFFILLTVNGLWAQPDTLWTKTFGGSEMDLSYSVQQTSDGGYIITGQTNSFGNGKGDVWLIKTDLQGDEEWNQTFGGTETDRGYSVEQTDDSGYIIVGVTESFGNGYDDLWLIKTDSNGNEEWNKTFGGSSYDTGKSVEQTSDGGYIITGYSSSISTNDYYDLWLIKTDSNGDSLWTKGFGGDHWERGHSVQQTTDGGYIVTGYTESFGSGLSDVWLLKTDSNGDSLWTKTFGGSSTDIGESVRQTNDNGYIIIGSNRSSGQDVVWLLKTNSNGNEEWNKTFGSNTDRGKSVQQTSDRGYIITGSTNTYGNGNSDVWLIKTDSIGDTVDYK